MYAPVEKQGSVLTGLSSEVLLRGSYQNIRNFLYELEVSEEFILIDDLSLNLEIHPGDHKFRLLDLNKLH